MLYLAQLALAFATMELKFTMKNQPSNRLFDTAGLLSARDAEAVETTVNLTSSYNFYYTRVIIGSPAQELEVIIDTGSPISWVYGPNATSQDGSANNLTKFHPADSSSWQEMPDKLSARYGAGSYMGSWGNDTLSLVDYDNLTIPNFPLGVVDSYLSSSGAPGLLALGPHVGNAGPSTYKNLPEALHDAGATNSSAFSISLKGDTGSVLFGGADLGQIEQPIYWFNYTDRSPSYSNFYTVPLTSVTVGNNSAHTVRYPAVIDTGAPVSLVPTGVVEEIAKKWNLTSVDSYRAYYLENDRVPSDLKGFVTFQLGSFTIDIPIGDMFVKGELIWGENGPQGVKALAVTGSMNNLLGDLFCRHAYMTFDSDTRRVYLSRRRSDNTTLPYIISPEGLEGLAVPGRPALNNTSTGGGVPSTGGGAGPGSVGRADESKEDQSEFVTSASSGGMLYGPAQYLGLAGSASIEKSGDVIVTAAAALSTAKGLATDTGSAYAHAMVSESAPGNLSSGNSSGSSGSSTPQTAASSSSGAGANGAARALPGFAILALLL